MALDSSEIVIHLFRVAKGPGKDANLNVSRSAVGITKSGKCFELVDDWTEEGKAHRVLEESFVGYTEFTQKNSRAATFGMGLVKGARWADQDSDVGSAD